MTTSFTVSARNASIWAETSSVSISSVRSA